MNRRRKVNGRRSTIGRNPLDKAHLSLVEPSQTPRAARRGSRGGIVKLLGGLLLGFAVVCFLWL